MFRDALLYGNPNLVTVHKDGDGEPSGVTTTPLERACDAYAAAVMAAAYPSDTKQRFIAIRACSHLDIEYIDVVARAAEKLDVDFHAARFHIANELHELVEHMRKHGGEPREGILANGREANEQGFADPDYGGLA